jgi:hypothetical protein
MAWEGRIAGISGIASRLLPPYADGAFLSRLGFILGLVAAPLIYMLVTGSEVLQTVSSNLPLMAVGGSAGWFRFGIWQWLHQRTWCLRAVAAFHSFAGGDHHLHGHGLRHCLHRPARTGSLTMSFVVNLALGLLFGIGLVVSGMSEPAKVLNFLDLAGTWDPSLAFVMGGAVVTTFVGYRIIFKGEKPLAAACVPTAGQEGDRPSTSPRVQPFSASAGA